MSKLFFISRLKKNKSSISPLNNFFKIPEIEIVKIDIYKKIWFNFAISFCPRKILFNNGGVGLKSL